MNIGYAIYQFPWIWSEVVCGLGYKFFVPRFQRNYFCQVRRTLTNDICGLITIG